MKEEKLINPLRSGLKANETGNKAKSLLFLQKNNFRIPETFVIPASILNGYFSRKEVFVSKLQKEIGKLPSISYAIRSSTKSEDSEDYTYAGQFQTITNVAGSENLVSAILEVWNSSLCFRDTEYRRKIANERKGCAILIQQMINSKLAGVSFSKNPITNQQEVIVEAIEGPGEDLVQKGLTPMRWRFKKDNILEGDTEYHLIMIIKKVASETLRLKKIFRNHVDIEWVFDGMVLYFLQFRPITGAREMNIYSNRMAKEMLPGQIKPLVWSINIPMVNGTWIRLLSEITGQLDIKPDDLAKPFYYRTYFNIAAIGRIFREFGLSNDILEDLMMSSNETKPSFRPGLKTLRHSFRIIRFLYSKLTFEKFYLREYERLKCFYADIEENINAEFSLENYTTLYSLLFSEGRSLTYLNIIVPLLMQIYNKRFKRKLKGKKIDYDQLNFNYDFPELIELSPITGIREIKGRINSLPESIKSEIDSFEKLKKYPETSHILRELFLFQKKFGHFSESGTDFSVPKWNENMEYVFHMIMKSESPDYNPGLLPFSELKKRRNIKVSWLRKEYLKAGRYKVYREQISSLFILGHGLFRSLFLKVGNELTLRGIIKSQNDIFYLFLEEINNILKLISSGKESESYDERITNRKEEMAATRDYVLPSVIFGDHAPILELGKIKNHSGVATSAGIYTGKTRVIKGMQDFDNVKRGDVLIIPFSDVSWTPILTIAGAIVSETGGLLSHCSIIAREMRIPALVSVENACSIGDELTVTVDGSNGILTIHDYE